MSAYKFAEKTFKGVYQRWNWHQAGYSQYGLKVHDVFDEGMPEVKEAIRRLPDHIQDERNFRIIRAMQLSINKTILPKEQWTTFEDEDYYLRPYLDEIEKEQKEQLEWAKK